MLLSELEFDVHGAQLLSNFLSDSSLLALQMATNSTMISSKQGGLRNVMNKIPDLASIIEQESIPARLRKYSNNALKLVRAIYFNKTKKQNWLVPWHQDLTVAVNDTFQATGWKNWTKKDDVWHVQAPNHVLDSMITIRLHLDDITEQNGCLKIIPESYKSGRLSHDKINDILANTPPINCTASAGDALIMKPHILHASPKAQSVSSRKIIHLEYSDYTLPNNISWA